MMSPQQIIQMIRSSWTRSLKAPRGQFSPPDVAGTRRPRFQLRPTLLCLEDRLNLSTFTVTSAVDSTNPGTLRWAVGQADSMPGSTIVFDPTRFSKPTTIALDPTGKLGELDLTASMTIQGPHARVTVDAQAMSRVFEVSDGATVTISSLSLVGGIESGYGGGIKVDSGGALNLDHSTISGCGAVEGGAIFSEGSTSLHDCTIVNNVASLFAGGVLAAFSNIDLTDCTLAGNTAPSSGAFNVFHGSGNLNHCTFTGNFSTSASLGLFGGGAMTLNLSDGTVTLKNCKITNNISKSSGGAISVPAGTVNLENSTVSGNSAAESGGAVYVRSGTVTLIGSTLSHNKAGTSGGGIEVDDGSLSLNATKLTANMARTTGGGVNISGNAKVSLVSTVFSKNQAKQGGSASYREGVQRGQGVQREGVQRGHR